jgi:hypothetical protein
MMATTIISSTRVKPACLLLRNFLHNIVILRCG